MILLFGADLCFAGFRSASFHRLYLGDQIGSLGGQEKSVGQGSGGGGCDDPESRIFRGLECGSRRPLVNLKRRFDLESVGG